LSGTPAKTVASTSTSTYASITYVP
jgi:hypothetical protein